MTALEISAEELFALEGFYLKPGVAAAAEGEAGGSSLGKGGLDLFEELVGDQLDIVLTYFDWVLLSASALLSGLGPSSELGKTAHVARLGKFGVALRGVG